MAGCPRRAIGLDGAAAIDVLADATDLGLAEQAALMLREAPAPPGCRPRDRRLAAYRGLPRRAGPSGAAVHGRRDRCGGRRDHRPAWWRDHRRRRSGRGRRAVDPASVRPMARWSGRSSDRSSRNCSRPSSGAGPTPLTRMLDHPSQACLTESSPPGYYPADHTNASTGRLPACVLCSVPSRSSSPRPCPRRPVARAPARLGPFGGPIRGAKRCRICFAGCLGRSVGILVRHPDRVRRSQRGAGRPAHRALRGGVRPRRPGRTTRGTTDLAATILEEGDASAGRCLLRPGCRCPRRRRCRGHARPTFGGHARPRRRALPLGRRPVGRGQRPGARGDLRHSRAPGD